MHIITPYNPWAPKKNKKSWQEEAWEQQQVAEIEARMLAEASSNTLPQNSPDTSLAAVGPSVNAAAGGGGQPPVQYFHPESVVPVFDRTPTTAIAPARIQFINLTPNVNLYKYRWVFSDGQTSNEIAPLMTFNSGSIGGYAITASLQLTGSTGTAGTASLKVYTVLSPPTITAGFTLVSSSKTAPSDFTFTNTSTNTSQIPSTTYKWVFGSGSITSSLTTPSVFTYTAPGGFTASLQSTGSYNITSSYTQSFRLA